MGILLFLLIYMNFSLLLKTIYGCGVPDQKKSWPVPLKCMSQYLQNKSINNIKVNKTYVQHNVTENRYRVYNGINCHQCVKC